MTGPLLPCVELATGTSPVLTIIWLHGLGADGHDFEPIVAELGLSFAARFVFPHAPVRPITINQGMPMRAWFDIRSFERGGSQDVDGVRDSARRVVALIERERAQGFAAAQIVIAGFSQGGALALHVGLHERDGISGILALSAFLVLPETLAAARTELPIFLAHGVVDPIVDMRLAESALAELRRLGYAPEWHTYAMGHAVCGPEIVDIARWLEARAADVTSTRPA